MKPLFIRVSAVLLFAASVAGCNNHSEADQSLHLQIESLLTQLKNSYKPGTGELISNIQLHHSKLWFAGENNNWLLAEYNESLIQSAFRKIQLYHGNTQEAKAAFMIDPAMDSVRNAIVQKDHFAFESAFRFLTLRCHNR